jgi:hypothetical protein
VFGRLLVELVPLRFFKGFFGFGSERVRQLAGDDAVQVAEQDQDGDDAKEDADAVEGTQRDTGGRGQRCRG